MTASHLAVSAPSLLQPATTPSGRGCPFRDGPATLDLLLAELDPRDTELFDAVLDLRSLWAARADAVACVDQLLRVRALLGGRHYLAFFRVRCWARREFRIEPRAARGDRGPAFALPLDCARLDELVNTALAALADASGAIPAGAHVRFTFAPTVAA